MAAAMMKLYVDSLWQKLEECQEPGVLGIIVALVVVLLTVVLFILLRSRKSTRRAILLTGLCDSGKTLLCCRLLSGKFKVTHTSVTSNSALYKVKGDKARAVTVHDLPGHESLRHQYLDKHKNDARAIIFVVDSVLFQKEVKDVAEFLYMLLTDAVIVKNAPPLLVVCNKQDVAMAKSSKLIQQQLEKELNTLRTIRSGAPKSLDGSGITGSVPLGKKGKNYDFSQGPMKIEFAECSARGNKGEGGEADIDVLESWIVKVA
ncbi:signal recognition particle receptor subunit beta [Narcine bancroftii]|uniref:signal recognition particle receptor subunit beta n=1 Tax=Narcine bancroftii TaxID=1343680 RepID=UPI0038318690